MTDKQLKRMSRRQLLEMLIGLTEENERLSQQLEETQEKLAEKEIAIASAGSIAEAALKINRVFEAAEAAAQQYLENIRGVQKDEHEEREAGEGNQTEEGARIEAEEREEGKEGQETGAEGPAECGSAEDGVEP